MLINDENTKLRILLITILRKDPNLIPEIIQNPLLIPRERISRRNALALFNVFNDSGFLDNLLNEFQTNNLEDFAIVLQNRLRVFFTDDDLISLEIEEIHKNIADPERSLKILPPNNYAVRNSQGSTIKIRYYLETRFISRPNDISLIIIISGHCKDDIEESIEMPVLLNHIHNNKNFHFVCNFCKRRFEITPSLLDFI